MLQAVLSDEAVKLFLRSALLYEVYRGRGDKRHAFLASTLKG